MKLEEEAKFELIEDDEVALEPLEEDNDEIELELIEEYEEEDEELELQASNLELVTEQVSGIVSDSTQQAGVDAFGQLAGIIAGRMQLGQGRTVEELVQELLRPLLREWLDQNLPGLVDELVKKEIERMVEKVNR
jgi:cell pole-organizing protein PopZ